MSINEMNTSSVIISANISSEDNPYHQRIETYVVPVLFALIFIVGLLGNGTLIVIFTLNKNLRNVPNTYIISLSLGDILVLVISLPFTSTIYTIPSWPYGELICKLSEALRDVSIGVSVFTLTALSADRYFAIVAPMKRHLGGQAGRATILVAVGIWFLSMVLAIPALLLSFVNSWKGTDGAIFHVCYPYPDYMGPSYRKANVMLKFLFYYALPLLIISGFYVGMAYHLVLSSRNVPGEPQSSQNKHIEARKKVAKVVLSFVLIFAICFFPNHVFMLWFYFAPNAQEDYNDFWHAFRIIGFCLCFINSCINPIALYCVSGVFRKYYNHYLFCCLLRCRARSRRRRGTFESRQSTMVNFNSTIYRTSTSISALQSQSV